MISRHLHQTKINRLTLLMERRACLIQYLSQQHPEVPTTIIHELRVSLRLVFKQLGALYIDLKGL